MYRTKNKLQLNHQQKRALGRQKSPVILSVLNQHATCLSSLDVTMRLVWRYGICYISQAALGDRTGVKRRQANVNVKTLATAGLIKKTYRHRNTCLMGVSSQLFSRDAVSILSTILPFLSQFAARTAHQQYSHADFVGITRETWGRFRLEEPPIWWRPPNFTVDPQLLEENPPIIFGLCSDGTQLPF
jgi:hypothetical protein